MTRTTALRSRLALVCAAVGLVGVLAPTTQAMATETDAPPRRDGSGHHRGPRAGSQSTWSGVAIQVLHSVTRFL